MLFRSDANGNKRLTKAAGMDLTATPPGFTAVSGLNGMLGTVTAIAKAGTDYKFTLSVTVALPLTVDWPAFVGGSIAVNGSIMTIAASDAASTSVTVAAANLKIPYKIHDDDDDTILPRNPLTTLMQAADDPATNVYAPAFIKPVYDGGGNAANNTLTVPFVLNTESAADYKWDSGANNANDFRIAVSAVVPEGILIGG